MKVNACLISCTQHCAMHNLFIIIIDDYLRPKSGSTSYLNIGLEEGI